MEQTRSKILVVLDLDETLIYATKNKLDIAENIYLSPYYVYERPGLRKFLVEIKDHFDLAIWSSADDAYVEAIVTQMIPLDVPLKFVWGRSRCSVRRNVLDEYCFEKRLGKVKRFGYQLDKILIVDDTHEKSRTNFGNAIHIKAFEGASDDAELESLMRYLLTLKHVASVRTIEKRGWRNAYT